ncbi:hypothetical protein M3J09_003214 [Ascochyta lentis]
MPRPSRRFSMHPGTVRDRDLAGLHLVPTSGWINIWPTHSLDFGRNAIDLPPDCTRFWPWSSSLVPVVNSCQSQKIAWLARL